jgi:hypothetical protein
MSKLLLFNGEVFAVGHIRQLSEFSKKPGLVLKNCPEQKKEDNVRHYLALPAIIFCQKYNDNFFGVHAELHDETGQSGTVAEIKKYLYQTSDENNSRSLVLCSIVPGLTYISNKITFLTPEQGLEKVKEELEKGAH